jgi:hypothetical protein
MGSAELLCPLKVFILAGQSIIEGHVGYHDLRCTKAFASTKPRMRGSESPVVGSVINLPGNQDER